MKLKAKPRVKKQAEVLRETALFVPVGAGPSTNVLVTGLEGVNVGYLPGCTLIPVEAADDPTVGMPTEPVAVAMGPFELVGRPEGNWELRLVSTSRVSVELMDEAACADAVSSILTEVEVGVSVTEMGAFDVGEATGTEDAP